MDIPDHPSVTDVSISDDMHTVKRYQIDLEMAPPEVLAKFMAPPTTDFAAWVAHQRSLAEQYLIDNGWPAPAQQIINDGTTWRACPDDPESGAVEKMKALRRGESLCNGATFIRKTAPAFSEDWFALGLYEACSTALRLEPADRDWPIFMLGHLFAVAQSRQVSRHVSKAKKNTRDARAGGAAKGQSQRSRTHSILSEMRKLISKGHSITRAADFVARRGIGTSAQANSRLWSRHS